MKINKFNITNPIYSELKKYKLISDENLVKISSSTRDKKISVYRDKKTKLIFLEKYICDNNYYSTVKYLNNNLKTKNSNVKTSTKTIKVLDLEDDERRSRQFKNILHNKNVLDFGCGWGGFLKNISSPKSLSGVELREECIEYIDKNLPKISLHNNIDLFDSDFDVITMFHVLEHIPNQVEILKILKKKLNKNGKLIIEIPHAEDFLLEFDELKEFKNFTFWSEHLILHTYKSLMIVLRKAGFKNIQVDFFQRFGFDNHLGWFIKKQPGGHDYFQKHSSDELNYAYKENLVNLKKTDTLIAIAY